MNIKIVAITAVLVVGCAIGYNSYAGSSVLGQLENDGISYVAAKKQDGMYISIFDKSIEPKTICDIADKFPKETVIKVMNAETDKAINCP